MATKKPSSRRKPATKPASGQTDGPAEDPKTPMPAGAQAAAKKTGEQCEIRLVGALPFPGVTLPGGVYIGREPRVVMVAERDAVLDYVKQKKPFGLTPENICHNKITG